MTQKKKRGRETIEGDKVAIRHISNLQFFRENYGLSKAKLARLSGISDEALHRAGGENETRGKAPSIQREIQEYQRLIDRVKGES